MFVKLPPVIVKPEELVKNDMHGQLFSAIWSETWKWTLTVLDKAVIFSFYSPPFWSHGKHTSSVHAPADVETNLITQQCLRLRHGKGLVALSESTGIRYAPSNLHNFGTFGTRCGLDRTIFNFMIAVLLIPIQNINNYFCVSGCWVTLSTSASFMFQTWFEAPCL